MATRAGWLVGLATEGLQGFGDCAPLPSAGTEDHRSASTALAEIASHAERMTLADLLGWADERLVARPATRFAIECALLDLASQLRGLPLRKLLKPSAPSAIQVNGMLGAIGELTAAGPCECIASGFKVIKIKVGLGSPDAELSLIRALARTLPPGIELRLDANGAWSARDAHWMIGRLASLPIESLEEPLRQPDRRELRALQAAASFPIALDESLCALLVDTDPGGLGVRRLVIKPAVIGGIRGAAALADQATAAGLDVVITSVVESAAGLWPTAQLAAAIGHGIAHGLATADWLEHDLGPAPRPVAGWLSLPDQPGTGFTPWPDEDRLTQRRKGAKIFQSVGSAMPLT
jgi:o-succinylbenzoate synthase